MQELLTFNEAFQRLAESLPSPQIQPLELEAALGRVVTEDLAADRDMPPYDKALMDGYALRSADLGPDPTTLALVGSSWAGHPYVGSVAPGEAVQITTGAALPADCDCVQRVEDTARPVPNRVLVRRKVAAGENVSRRGAEVRRGQTVVPRGTPIGPAHVGVLAAFGYGQVPVWAPPRVLVLSSGDELVALSDLPGPEQIRDSNGPMLRALCREAGVVSAPPRVLPDDFDATRRQLERSDDFDVIILSGGVSVGEKDYVHQVIAELGGRVLFHQVAIKPGKPVLCARRGRQLIFGLPGNPVSCLVTFLLFVRPALRALLGFTEIQTARVPAILTADVRQKAGRLFFKPARLQRDSQRNWVSPVDTAGSSDLTAFAAANALLWVPAECAHLPAGERVDVIPLPDLQGRTIP